MSEYDKMIENYIKPIYLNKLLDIDNSEINKDFLLLYHFITVAYARNLFLVNGVWNNTRRTNTFYDIIYDYSRIFLNIQHNIKYYCKSSSKYTREEYITFVKDTIYNLVQCYEPFPVIKKEHYNIIKKYNVKRSNLLNYEVYAKFLEE